MLHRANTSAPSEHPSFLGRDVLIALTIKMSLLAVLYLCFFAQSHRPSADPGSTAGALLDHRAVQS